MKLKPLFDRIIIERLETESKTGGGIIIPSSAKEEPVFGIVVAIGKNVKDINVGDKIVFPRFGGNEINLENKKYLVMKELDVLGVIDGSQN